MSRGQICGSTTRRMSCQVEAPSVCALMSCSARQLAGAQREVAHDHGRDADDDQRDLRDLASPSTMNRIGSIASGGIIDSAATNGASVARTSGITPMRDAEHQPDAPR